MFSFRKLFARSSTRKRPVQNRARLTVESLEDRSTPSVTAASITSITSTADTDGNAADQHVTVAEGSTADIVINFTYTANQTSSATGTILGSAATGTTSGLAAGTNLAGSVSIPGSQVAALLAGNHNVQLKVTDTGGPGPHQQIDTESQAVVISVAITAVETTTTVTAPDADYDGEAYDEADVVVTPDGTPGEVTLTYYAASDLINPLLGAPTDAGDYRVVAHFTPDDTDAYTESEGYADFTISQVGSTVTVAWDDGTETTYDGEAHGATASWSSTGADGEGAFLPVSYEKWNGSSWDAIAEAPTDAGLYRASATFAGDTNHTGSTNSAEFTIIPKSLGSSPFTQAALNIAKNGVVPFRIDVDETGIVDGQSVADLFNGALFSLKVGTSTYSIEVAATVVDGIVEIKFNMSDELKAILAENTTAKNANTAPTVGLELSAVSNDGNYTLDGTALTKLFNK